jgi:hypothetical protein
MKIGVDLDGTITRYPAFFAKLSQIWHDDVYIVTYRPPNKQRDTEELTKLGIKYTDILYAKEEYSKAELCEQFGIEVLFDDDPCFLIHCKVPMLALLVRNEENFDYEKKQYLFTSDVARIQTQNN